MMAIDAPASVAAWRLESGGLFMRASDDESGKLARLADVRDWLMYCHEWPMERAAEEILNKLRQAHDAGLQLFIGQAKAYARVLRSDDHMLSLEALRERGGLFGLDERLQGFKGVCNAIINGWLGEYAGYGGSFARVDAVCVRAADAAQLWGWGSVGAVEAAAPATAHQQAVLQPGDVKDPATLVRYRQQFNGVAAQKRPAWTSEHRAFLGEAVSLHGGAAELAKLWGVTAEAVRGQLRKAKAEAAEKKRAEAFISGLRQRAA